MAALRFPISGDVWRCLKSVVGDICIVNIKIYQNKFYHLSEYNPVTNMNRARSRGEKIVGVNKDE